MKSSCRKRVARLTALAQSAISSAFMKECKRATLQTLARRTCFPRPHFV